MTRRFAVACDDPPDIATAWQRLTETAGRLAVSALARELGYSRQHLVRRFRAEIGLPPKAVARVLRFERAVAELEARNGRNLGEVAHACGYYDQAHLNRDFLKLAGTTPTAYLAHRLAGGAGVVWPGGDDG